MKYAEIRVIVRLMAMLVLLSGRGAWEALAMPLADVSFADPNLQACVQRVAQAHTVGRIPRRLTSPTCPNDDLADLDSLEAFGNLVTLALANNIVAGLTLLA
jgi:hypothetical protein